MTDTLPHSLEAEAAVLACMMFDPAAAVHASRLSPDDFYRTAHRTVFEVCVELLDGGQPDTPSVLDRLRATGQLEEVGGTEAVNELADTVLTVASVERHVETVANLAARRRAFQAARRLQEAARDRNVDLDGAVDRFLADVVTEAGRTGVITVDDVQAALDERIAGTYTVGSVSTGWPNVDRLYRVPRGMTTVVTGVPGHGKSTFVDALTVQIAYEHDWRFAVWSPEQAPADKHAYRLLSAALGRTPRQDDTTRKARRWLHDRFRWVDPDLRELPQILMRARAIQHRHGLDGLVIDPWNQIVQPKDARRYDLQLREQLAMCTAWARSSGCHLWVVAHPTKMTPETQGSSRWKIPTVYDISGGSEWNNQADAVLAVWRDQNAEVDRADDTKIVVQKIRDLGDWGRLGVAELRFDESCRRYYRPGQMQGAA